MTGIPTQYCVDILKALPILVLECAKEGRSTVITELGRFNIFKRTSRTDNHPFKKGKFSGEVQKTYRALVFRGSKVFKKRLNEETK